jgi:hypothetical protein
LVSFFRNPVTGLSTAVPIVGIVPAKNIVRAFWIYDAIGIIAHAASHWTRIFYGFAFPIHLATVPRVFFNPIAFFASVSK